MRTNLTQFLNVEKTQQKKPDTKQIAFGALLFFLLHIGASLPASGQVTIGASEAPQPYSILEVISEGTNLGGLRLPQVKDNAERTEIQNRFSTNMGKSAGLLIFNQASKLIEYWDGTKWVSDECIIQGAENGLTLDGDKVILGGILNRNTEVSTGNNSLSFRGTAPNSVNVTNSDASKTIFSVDPTNNRVGVNITDPQNELDVNGNARIRSMGNGQNDQFSLTTGEDLVVRRVRDRERVVVTVAAGATAEVNHTVAAGTSHITIISGDLCTNRMIVEFSSYLSAIYFKGGVAATELAEASIEGVYPYADLGGNTNTTTAWEVSFKDSGSDCLNTQIRTTDFGFVLRRLSASKYSIKNNAKIARTYTFFFKAL